MPAKRDLTQGSTASAIFRLTLPMIGGIVAVLSVALVDTYYVSKLGTAELAALSFTFPVTLALASLSIGLGAGAASVVSRAVGSGDSKGAQRLSTDSLLLALLIVAAVSSIGYFSVHPLFSLLGASGEVLDLIAQYMHIWYLSMPFLVMPMVANALMRAIGDAVWPSAIMVGTSVVNIVVTPIFVFGWQSIPAYGLRGAAIGTLIAYAFTLLLSLYVVVIREKLVTLALPTLEELQHSWQRVLKVAIPAAAGSMVNPVGVAFVTALLATFGDITVAAFGVATRIESFACIPMLALSAAIGPIAGQNWGAGFKDRVIRALGQCYVFCLLWSAFVAILLWIFAGPVSQVLASSDAVARETRLYLAIVPFSLAGYGIVITTSAAYNSLGKALTGLGYYLLRTAVLYVPFAWLASIWFGAKEVFIAIAIANILAGLIAACFALRWLRQTQLTRH